MIDLGQHPATDIRNVNLKKYSLPTSPESQIHTTLLSNWVWTNRMLLLWLQTLKIVHSRIAVLNSIQITGISWHRDTTRQPWVWHMTDWQLALCRVTARERTWVDGRCSSTIISSTDGLCKQHIYPYQFTITLQSKHWYMVELQRQFLWRSFANVLTFTCVGQHGGDGVFRRWLVQLGR